MSKHRCKGTVLQQRVSAAFVAVAQIISLDGPGMESETFEADTLDNVLAGIPYQSTDRTEGGSLSGELFFDPVLAGHENLLLLLKEPAHPEDAATASNELWKILFADPGATEWPFEGAGFSLSPAIVLNDGLKASFGIKLSGIPTFPSTGSV